MKFEGISNKEKALYLTRCSAYSSLRTVQNINKSKLSQTYKLLPRLNKSCTARTT